MKDKLTRSLTVPGDFEPTRRDKGRIDGVYPTTLLLGVYRRTHDNSPCFLYLRTWPDGRIQFSEAEHDPSARLSLVRSSSLPGAPDPSRDGDCTPACPTT